MNIAVIGSGGREHAIAWKLEQSELVDKVYVLPGNGGTENNVNIDVNNFEMILNFCRHNTIELIFVGPEDPLAAGIVDFFADTPVKVFGPDKAGAQLEGSKIYAKRFMQKYGVATGAYQDFGGVKNDCCQQLTIFPKDTIKKMNGNCVIKYDGLAAGKGVFVCSTQEEAMVALDEVYSKYGEDASYLIEERLEGDELSILAFTDGKDYQLLLPSQDHKQLLDGDKGPNTGGMGAFCPVPFYNDELKKQIENDIIKPTMQGIKEEGYKYKGVVYFGLMITENGPKLLEYNVRLGDPETEVVLPAMKSDLVELLLSCFDGSLVDYKMEFNDGFFVDVVLVSGGYPAEYKKGYHICGIKDDQELLFHAGTKKVDFQVVSSGGRVLNVVEHGGTLEEAIDRAYNKVNDYYFEDMFYRKDIGRRK
ncbi:MAG: phosphoribosylamine--glycine ligase [Candidatus Cloacimonetes bacterium]|jgi:phosphoribosylamine--glycine ligase|nr:phosphoribosylamine--glycine ligase [Candidatus Cloacimonadota bacterium]MBT4332850.1 phosphoribosylamine--glycine ligase [Candidatus Cloacimonadota bacterium]MBT4576324.1 phosphoribosylamine--glycine ligase [Candidatus Cloacimonadota bacterium]MBT5420231.1 phosphoribosylamine--glycine ligase [Candidatus Cloacimonadota bacterium]